MTQAYAQLLAAVDQTRRAWRARRALEGATLTLAAAAAALLVAGAVDLAVDAAPAGRWTLAALVWAAAIAMAWTAWICPLRARHSPDYFAALLEQKLMLGNRLINAFQLGRADHASAPKLTEAIVNDGARDLDDLDPGPAVRSPALRRNMLALAAALAALALFAGLGGPAARAALARVAMPAASIKPFTWTRLDVTLEPDADRLLEGRPLTVIAITRGRPAEAAAVRIASTDPAGRTTRRTVAMTSVGQGRFSATLEGLRGDNRLHVDAGDARSPTFRLAVDPRPRITAATAAYDYPDYTARPDAQTDAAQTRIEALRGTRVTLDLTTNRPMAGLTLRADDQSMPARPLGQTDTEGHATQWRVNWTLHRAMTLRPALTDPRWGEQTGPSVFGVAVIDDRPPMIAITRPGRDAQARPDETIRFELAAHDDVGLDALELRARRNDDERATTLHRWDIQGPSTRRVTRALQRTIDDLGLGAGDRLTYWALALDRNNADPQGPGRAASRKYRLHVLDPEQAARQVDDQLVEFSRAVAQLIQLQQRNRAETAEHRPAGPLVERQAVIRSKTRGLAALMERRAFPGRTIIDALRDLAAQPMVDLIAQLERYRDAPPTDAPDRADASLPTHDRIIARLEQIQRRLDRNAQTRRRLRRAEQAEPEKHEQVAGVVKKLAEDLDEFLGEMKQIDEKYEKMPARADEPLTAKQLEELEDIEHRLDRWKKWSADAVDAITKLPEGFVPDGHLAENVSTIFEEIEKQAKSPTREIATPTEEGIKALAEEVAEDLEMWMPDSGDNKKWVMESPPEGKFEVPEMELPSNLQDMIGDLVEDVDEFDEEADDITGAWGGNMQAGWAIDDGPISSFGAKGKTGNQLPNASEMGGRSGAGRRGRSSGQMVGAESNALEGRPTPARVTNEPYEKGVPDAKKQLDPRGATGGGKKTGGGQKGLQGFNPPDFVKDMKRLNERQKMLREKAHTLAREMQRAGRPLTAVHRAIDLMGDAGDDLQDLRYQDAARKRKAALQALRAAERQADAGLTLSLQRARDLPPHLRERISAGASKALPEGYEQIVGAYYRALSEEADD